MMLKVKKINYEEINNLYVNHLQLFNKLERIAKMQGLTFAQYSVLLSITDYDCKTPTDITASLKISRTSTSKTLNILLKKQLIKKVYGAGSDQRKVIIEVESQGSKLVENIKKELSSAVIDQFLGNLA